MSLLSRIRSFLSSLFGGDESAPVDGEASPGETAASTDSTAGTAGEADDSASYRCSVCGTAVEDAVGPCPLCRSSEIVPADEVDASLADDDPGLDTEGATVTRTRDDVDPVSRLDEVRGRASDGDSDDDRTGSAEE
jgi:hypothetical protein